MKKNSKNKDNLTFPIVGIGGSAGGLEAYQELLENTPDNTGMAFVLIQHLAPTYKSALSEILTRHSKIPVVEAKNSMKVEPNKVYVIPPDADLSLKGGKLILTSRKTSKGIHTPIDYFFQSLASNCGNRAVGVIFSGTGSDGVLGVEAIKSEGGITFSQRQSSAKFSQMPANAEASGCIDFVLTPKEIASELSRISHHPYLEKEGPVAVKEGDLPPESAETFTHLLSILRFYSKVDFTQYKPATILRRLNRRMIIRRTESPEQYLELLKVDPVEIKALYDDILITVTKFFRDTEVFETLTDSTLPRILKNKSVGEPIRIWVPGCSSGQEVYSIVICLLEVMGNKVVQNPVQVFGTDISDKVIEKARKAIYSKSIAEEVSPERLARFFVKLENGYQIVKTIRDMCVFAQQNVTADPPFSRMDLISCRNLLIYLGPELQKRIIPIFHYALNPNGMLLLGNSESISLFNEYFELADKNCRIYYKKPIAFRKHYDFPTGTLTDATMSGLNKNFASHSVSLADPKEISRLAEKELLSHFAPTGVIVNKTFEVVYSIGDTSPYLSLGTGTPNLNIFKLVPKGLSIELRALLLKAGKGGFPQIKNGIKIPLKGKPFEFSVEVKSLKTVESTQNYYLILFNETKKVPDTNSKKQLSKKTAELLNPKEKDERIRILERELDAMKELLETNQRVLQSSIEDQESFNEELKSSNEEILSSNEELQSTNEELETAKEELQSSNEELTTVNEELHNRNFELSEMTNDLSNLFANVSIPVIMIGRDMKIRRFNKYAQKILKLIPTDVGRSLGDIQTNIKVTNLNELVSNVYENIIAKEIELQNEKGEWNILRLQPYRTNENKIDGVVLTLLDIHQLKTSRDFAQTIIETLPQPLLVLNRALQILNANQAFLSLFKVVKSDLVNRNLFEIKKGALETPEFTKLINRTLHKDFINEKVTLELPVPDSGARNFLINVRQLSPTSQGTDNLLLLSLEDVTEIKSTEMQIKTREFHALSSEVFEGQTKLDLVLSQMPAMLWVVDTDFKIITSLGSALSRINVSPNELVGKSLYEYLQTDDSNHKSIVRHRDAMQGAPQSYEEIFMGKVLAVHIDPYRNIDGKILGCIGVAIDVTDIKKLEEKLLMQQQILELIAIGKDLQDIFDTAINMIEPMEEGVRASILLLDESGKHLKLGAAPNLPDDYNAAIDGIEIGPNVGSCGTAAYLGKTIVAENIATDPLWTNYRSLALKHNLQACWSQPIFSGTGKILGTFAMYYSKPKRPDGNQLQSLSVLAHLIAIAIERRQYDDHLKTVLHELERSNMELEQFAYAASHDLQEPLRTITSYLQLISRNVNFDATNSGYMTFVITATNRLRNLIQDLLVYARVGSKRSPDQNANCQMIVTDIKKYLEASIIENNAEISHDSLPVLSAATSDISLLFQNLISNAIKYRREVSPKIEILVKKQQNFWRFSVKDNGIGIAEEHIEQLFYVFRRLHPAQDYPGTGVGLALCKKVVEIYGGKIWIESELGVGTTFCFTLPA